MRLMSLFIAFTLLVLFGTLVPSYRILANDKMLETSVKITNLAETSGGSGVLVKTTDNESHILTNAHVCRLFKNVGGLVHSFAGTAKVKEYVVDTNHDICLIVVDRNFKVSAKLANESPKFGDKVSVVGHPRLLPTIRTDGYLSERSVISVVVDMRQCQPKDDPLMCLLLGGAPMVEIYDTIVISALIQPGSSGSGVYNESGEVIGLVFAGMGNLSFGNIVPLENVKNFYEKVSTLDRSKFVKPNYVQDVPMQQLIPDFVIKCSSLELTTNSICNNIRNSFTWGFIRQ